MQRKSGCSASVFDHRLLEFAAIDVISTNGMPKFHQVNSYLVSSPCFQLALNLRVFFAVYSDEGPQWFDVSDRFLAVVWLFRAAAQSITSITDQPASRVTAAEDARGRSSRVGGRLEGRGRR